MMIYMIKSMLPLLLLLLIFTSAGLFTMLTTEHTYKDTYDLFHQYFPDVLLQQNCFSRLRFHGLRNNICYFSHVNKL